MGVFNTHKVINTDPSYIPEMVAKITSQFKMEGYEIDTIASDTGAYDISITKGGLFRTVSGLKTALKITLKPYIGKVSFDAGVGILRGDNADDLALFVVCDVLFLFPGFCFCCCIVGCAFNGVCLCNCAEHHGCKGSDECSFHFSVFRYVLSLISFAELEIIFYYMLEGFI